MCAEQAPPAQACGCPPRSTETFLDDCKYLVHSHLQLDRQSLDVMVETLLGRDNTLYGRGKRVWRKEFSSMVITFTIVDLQSFMGQWDIGVNEPNDSDDRKYGQMPSDFL